MGYLFSVKDREVCFNKKSFEVQKPSYFGEPNFLDGDLSLPPTKENITAVSIAFTFLFMNSGGMFVDPNYFGDKHNRDGRLFVNYSKMAISIFLVQGIYSVKIQDSRMLITQLVDGVGLLQELYTDFSTRILIYTSQFVR